MDDIRDSTIIAFIKFTISPGGENFKLNEINVHKTGVDPKMKLDNSFNDLAIQCNSKVIEIYGDRIRVSQKFRACQMLEYNTQT